MSEFITKNILKIMPKRSLSQSAYWLARRQWPSFVLKRFINSYSEFYGVNVDECELDLNDFKTFDSFFTRSLKKDARAIDTDQNSLISPCDGALAEFGDIDGFELEQIKGKSYQLDEFLKSDSKAKEFEGGTFVTIYLSPKDYHRVHFPTEGEVQSFHYIPGELFPVNQPSVKTIDHLFSRNERLIVYLKRQEKTIASVMVGATCVGCITQSYDHKRRFLTRQKESKKTYFEPIPVSRGEEMGVFHMGSTVVLLFPKNTVKLLPLESGMTLRFGQKLGEWY